MRPTQTLKLIGFYAGVFITELVSFFKDPMEFKCELWRYGLFEIRKSWVTYKQVENGKSVLLIVLASPSP